MKNALAFAAILLAALGAADAFGQTAAGPSYRIVPDSALIGRALWYGGRGYQIGATRSKGVQEVLDIEWKYPVHAPSSGEVRPDQTQGVSAALPLEESFRIMADGDLRPLLVLREFDSFEDPDSVKLSRKLYTERTVLLSHWFRCVRLPHQVVEADHPFHNVFAGKDPPRLLLANADGTGVVPFDFHSTRADLEKLMIQILEEHYATHPGKNVDSLLKLFQDIDQVEIKRQGLKEKLDRAIEQSGMGKVRKVEQELKACEQDYQALKEKRDALRHLPFKAESGPDAASRTSDSGRG